MKKFLSIGVVALLGCVLAASSASAVNINNLIVTGANTLSDEDREYLIDRVGGIVGEVNVGDSLRGSINFNTVNSAGANLGGITGNDELSGVFQVLVTSIAPIAALPGLSAITFGADPAFAASLAAMGIAVSGGEVAALFTDPTVDFCGDFTDTGCAGITGGVDDGTIGPATVPPSSADVSVGPYATEEAFIATATDGALWATFGFTGTPGEGMAGTGPTNILTAFTLTSGSSAGNINAGLGLISTGAGFDPNIIINTATTSPFGGLVDFAFSQQLRGVSDLNTPFEIATNTNVSFDATVVPEPSTLLLFGGGLLGLSALMRRRNKKA